MANKSTITRRKNRAEESDNLSAIMEYLQWNKIFAFRVNNTPVFDPARKVFRKMGKFTPKGVADILGIYKGKPLAIEVKASKGVVSSDQKDFLREFTQNGGIAIVATSPQEVHQDLKNLFNNIQPNG